MRRRRRSVWSLAGAVLVVAGTIAQVHAQDRQVIRFIDPDSKVLHAQLEFDGVGDGRMTLFERWCSPDGRECAAGGLPVPPGFARFFETETSEPVLIELENDVTIKLNPLSGIDASLGTVSFATGKPVSRQMQILQGENRETVTPPEMEAARTIELAAVGYEREPMRVLIADNEGRVPAYGVGSGSVIEFPAGWCGETSSVCPGFSIEPGRDVLKQWADGETLEDEPFIAFISNLEMKLFRAGSNLSVEVTEYLRDGQRTARFESTSDDPCHTEDDVVGSVHVPIRRVLDDACIGEINWAAVPDPRAGLTLTNGWCGRPECGRVEIESDSWLDEPFPTRFWVGQTIGPSLMITFQGEPAVSPGIIQMGKNRVVARFSNDQSGGPNNVSNQPGKQIGQTYAIAHLDRPLGIYALLENRTELGDAKNVGDNLCQLSPLVFTPHGKVWFKRLGAPVGGNPYHFQSWMDCSTFEGSSETCVMHDGSPDAPTPVGARSGFSYTPVGGGHFKMCRSEDADDCALLYACLGPDTAIPFDRTFPSTGGNMANAILERRDGSSPGFRYIDNLTIALEE